MNPCITIKEKQKKLYNMTDEQFLSLHNYTLFVYWQEQDYFFFNVPQIKQGSWNTETFGSSSRYLRSGAHKTESQTENGARSSYNRGKLVQSFL
jgi:hypothetical protein